MNRIRKMAAGAALMGTTLAGGALAGGLLTGTANAATTPTTEAASSAAPGAPGAPGAQHDPGKGGHSANGITETLLTGDTATKAEAAAKAAVPGATVDRVETDAEGAVYEAHMTKADGSHVTVKLDASFGVTTIETN
jgi:hypothetical protein